MSNHDASKSAARACWIFFGAGLIAVFFGYRAIGVMAAFFGFVFWVVELITLAIENRPSTVVIVRERAE